MALRDRSLWLHGKPVPNRLKLIDDGTGVGGGLAMIGGDLSVQGIDGKARCGRIADRPILARLPDEEGGHELLVTGRFGQGRTVLGWAAQ